MSHPLPYTLFACPCSERFKIITNGDFDRFDPDNNGAQENKLNPHSPRANFNLYPLEDLLFCNECHELRCPRCYYEEAMYYYCPNCLDEYAAAAVKGESNRCSRSCNQCPVCFSTLAVNRFQDSDQPREDTEDIPVHKDGPFILTCPYCSWSTLDIGITLEKSLHISTQLKGLKNGGDFQDAQESAEDENGQSQAARPADADRSDQFARLTTFYREQLIESNPSATYGNAPVLSLSVDSPDHLSSILTRYGATGFPKQKGKMPLMREAYERDGLHPFTAASAAADDQATISRLRAAGWAGTSSVAQRAAQLATSDSATRFTTALRPIPTPLRSRRAKRCRTCRYALSRPDDKRHSTRFKIRLLALNSVPHIALRPLHVPAGPLPSPPPPLAPHRAVQFVLTLRNPLFDKVRVKLATPAITPGVVASRVTILCPQFEVGANADVWEEALDEGQRGSAGAAEGATPEAGKVWERGRNWTSVVVEIVPGIVPVLAEGEGPLDEVDVLEVPVFVRMEYETEEVGTDSSTVVQPGKSENKVQRELMWWCVLGVGRIAAS